MSGKACLSLSYHVYTKRIDLYRLNILAHTYITHCCFSVNADTVTESIDGLVSKFARENRFTMDQRNDFLSCVVRDKYWDSVVEFKCDIQKHAPYSRYGLVSKTMVGEGMKCTFGFLEVRLNSRDTSQKAKHKNGAKDKDSGVSIDNNVWEGVLDEDIRCYFRQRAVYSLRFEEEVDESDESEHSDHNDSNHSPQLSQHSQRSDNDEIV